MPILAMDQFGRVYETDPDQPDGSGYKGATPCVEYTKDVVLGGSTRREEIKRNAFSNAEADYNRRMDRLEEDRCRMRAERQKIQDEIDAREDEEAQKPENQRTLLQRAAEQGTLGWLTPGMSANGEMGAYGRTKEQLGAQLALGVFLNPNRLNQLNRSATTLANQGAPNVERLNMSEIVAPVDPIEARQTALNALAEAQRRKEALRLAQLNEWEASRNQKDVTDSGDYRKQYEEMQYQRQQPTVVRGNPMMVFLIKRR